MVGVFSYGLQVPRFQSEWRHNGHVVLTLAASAHYEYWQMFHIHYCPCYLEYAWILSFSYSVLLKCVSGSKIPLDSIRPKACYEGIREVLFATLQFKAPYMTTDFLRRRSMLQRCFNDSTWKARDRSARHFRQSLSCPGNRVWSRRRRKLRWWRCLTPQQLEAWYFSFPPSNLRHCTWQPVSFVEEVCYKSASMIQHGKRETNRLDTFDNL